MIHGTVVAGTGRASRLHTSERLAVRSEAAGMDLVAGTLNVQVDDAAEVLAGLRGSGRHVQEPWCRIGPGLGVYPVTVHRGDRSRSAVVTRSQNSRSRRTLEIMADVHLRSLWGLEDGDVVTLERRPWVD